MSLKSAHHYRAIKARAAQTGDSEAALRAEIGLRASRVAKAIDSATADAPPFPPDVVAALCARLLSAGGAR